MTTFPFLCPLFDIPVRLDDLFQWIAPIDDRLYLPRLNQLFEEDQIFNLISAV